MVSLETKAAVTSALASPRADDVVEGVKSAVIRELQTLDRNLEIESTQYFNHTFVPDLVVSWKEYGRETKRPVFLRLSLRAALLGGDVGSLATFDPILLTLTEESEDPSYRASAAGEMPESSSLLLTEVQALDRAADEGVADSESPLLALVRNSIVRGGRGVLDEATAELLTATANPREGEDVAAERFGEFRELAQRLFSPSAALQLQRASDLLRVGLSDDADSVLAELEAQGDGESALSGNLSTAELQSLLPYLLRRSDVTRGERFWQKIGSMMNLRRLEEMASLLDDVDLDPLVLPNLQIWEGTKAGFTSVAEDEALPPENPISNWRLHGGLLSAQIENWRLHVSHDRNRIRGRSDSPSARWIDLAPALRSLDVMRIQLRGVTRLVDVGQAESGGPEHGTAARDVRSDVEAITRTIGEDFFVPVADVRDADQPAGSISADFTKMVATASQPVPLRSLARAGLRVLCYRYPPSDAAVARLLRNSSQEPSTRDEEPGLTGTREPDSPPTSTSDGVSAD